MSVIPCNCFRPSILSSIIKCELHNQQTMTEQPGKQLKEKIENILEHEPACSITIYLESKGKRGSPTGCDCNINELLALFAEEKQKILEEIQYKLEWNVGTGKVKNFVETYPEALVYNKEHVDKILDNLKSLTQDKGE